MKYQPLTCTIQIKSITDVYEKLYFVFALGAVADFGSKNCQDTTKADARNTLELTTKTAIEPNACYALFFLLIICELKNNL